MPEVVPGMQSKLGWWKGQAGFVGGEGLAGLEGVGGIGGKVWQVCGGAGGSMGWGELPIQGWGTWGAKNSLVRGGGDRKNITVGLGVSR